MALDIRTALARMMSRRDHPRGSQFSYPQVVRQFNALLRAAKERYPERVDILALDPFETPTVTRSDEFVNTARRLQDALETEPEQETEMPLMHQKFGILRAEPQLTADFDASSEDNAGVGLLFIDIDHFKALNTKYTETIVDRNLLIPFHRLLVELVRHRGHSYCVGGDEFIILLRNTDLSETSAFAERLLRTVEDATFDFDDQRERVTLSVGVAHYPDNGKTLADVRERANYSESRAKSDGRNRAIVYSNIPPSE